MIQEENVEEPNSKKESELESILAGFKNDR